MEIGCTVVSVYGSDFPTLNGGVICIDNVFHLEARSAV